MAFKFALAAMESAAPYKQSIPPFTQIHDIHKDLMSSMKREMTTYAIDFTEYSCSKCTYAIYEKKGGGLLSKGKYEFSQEANLSRDAFFALRQFYYMVHAALYDSVFNYLTVFVEAKDGKVTKLSYSVGHDKGIDGAEGASHATPGVKMGAVKAVRGESIGVTSSLANVKI